MLAGDGKIYRQEKGLKKGNISVIIFFSIKFSNTEPRYFSSVNFLRNSRQSKNIPLNEHNILCFSLTNRVCVSVCVSMMEPW